MKPIIPGVILIISCHKHKDTRLKEFALSKNEYAGWKVFIILGNPLLESSCVIDGNVITIKCEDSYVHIMKKLVMSIYVLFELYDIQEGILRCGDDLIFNEDKLENFLKMPDKKDYMGKIANPIVDKIITKNFNRFMPDYFYRNQDDLQNPLNGLDMSLNHLLHLNQTPNITYTGGVVVYLSKNACSILINEFKETHWNVFYYYVTYGFPYIIEDIGVGFALWKNNILPVNYELYTDKQYDILTIENDINEEYIAYHTNKYK